MVRELERLTLERATPKTMVSDNGTELTSGAVLRWATEGSRGTTSSPANRSRTPSSKASTASFAMSVLTSTCSASLGEARAIIEAWRHDYNRLRPPSSLGYLAPEEFAARNQGSSAVARTAGQPRSAGRRGADRADLEYKTRQFFSRPQRVKGGRKAGMKMKPKPQNNTPSGAR